ncbi:GreA/GreB family elongation factor [Cohnella sp. WQ 127256]|uniref:GreA/GreB family elongation factor n=1 Tax=Cohnella sp. WQ 127256 TaxID=2938790 RepID=UPI002117D8B1|nr:GreA/GreB family elongation factor [Cohnella sp. WQ 127256]
MSHSHNERLHGDLTRQLSYFEKETKELLRKVYPDMSKRDEMQKLLDSYTDHIRLFQAGSIAGDTDSLVWIGSSVTIQDEIDRLDETYKIVMPHEVNVDLGHISFLSPLGSKLLLARKDNRIEVESPSGSYEVIIMNVSRS